jgi:hypothetical protein
LAEQLGGLHPPRRKFTDCRRMTGKQDGTELLPVYRRFAQNGVFAVHNAVLGSVAPF